MGGESSKDLTPRQLEDLRKQTPFTPKELKGWYRKFSDECPSGHMTKEDFKMMYENLFPKGDSNEFSEIVFKAYDKDGNGMIDFQEFVCTVGIASRGSIDEKLRWAFDLYDIDNNGYVTKQEIAAIFKAIFKMRGSVGVINGGPGTMSVDDAVEHIFTHLDKDGDERLSDLEFIVGAKASPSVLSILDSDQAVK